MPRTYTLGTTPHAIIREQFARECKGGTYAIAAPETSDDAHILHDECGCDPAHRTGSRLVWALTCEQVLDLLANLWIRAVESDEDADHTFDEYASLRASVLAALNIEEV